MIRQARAFGLSLGIHATACLFLLLAGMISPKTRAVVLDFSIGAKPGREAPAPAMRNRAARRQERTVTPTAQDEQAAPVRKEQTEETPQPLSQEPARDDKTAGADKNASSRPGTGEAEKAAYLSAHFAYIRDKIFRNIAYPPVARRMGWEGKVTVSFTVCADGSVENAVILESSGYPVLDRSALEAIRKSCPLPRPSTKTALVMPVVYRLE